jgi:hypothetical protein
MAKTYRKQRVVGNTGRRAFGSATKKKYAKKKRPGHGHRSNPAEILGFTLANTGRRKGTSSMAKTKKKRSTHKKAAGYGHHRTNTGHTKHKKYRRNAGTMSGLTPLVTNAAFVIIGALGTKLATQAVLGTNNTGLVGYAGNAAVGGVLWFITEKFMKNRAASTGILSGTIVQILLRVINDYTPFGQYVAQLGMGDYQMQSFVTPQVLVDPWNSAQIAVPPGWGPAPGQPAQIAAPAGRMGGGGPANSMPSTVPAGSSGMSGLYGNGGGWGPGLYSA